MANRFWVGGGSANTWAATGNTNWATTSGGANNASVPTTTDVAIFDGGSGTSNSVIGASIAVQGLDCTGGTGNYAGTITHNTGVTLTINTGAASSLRFTPGMTYTPASTSSLVTFTNTSGTAQLTSAGKAFAAITMNGVGGTAQQKDDLNVNAVGNAPFTITNGVWDANDSGAAHALNACLVIFSANNTRSFILGGTVSIGGNISTGNTIWNAGNIGTLTFTKNSANIIILTPSVGSPPYSITFAGAGLTYNNLTLNASTNGPQLDMSGANTFSNLTIDSGWSVRLPQGTTQTIINAFAWVGTQTSPIMIYASSVGGTATVSVSSGTCTFNWGGLLGITGAGGAAFTATNVFNFNNNIGWSITPPADGTTSGLVSAIWRDTTAGDFTVSGSIGKSLFTSGNTPGAASGLALVGSAVNTTQIAGSTTSATNLSATTNAIGRGVVTAGATTTSIPTSAMSPAGAVANQFGSNINPRVMLFDATTATAALQGQATVVSASTNAAHPTFTVNALTTAPVSGDTFSIL